VLEVTRFNFISHIQQRAINQLYKTCGLPTPTLKRNHPYIPVSEKTKGKIKILQEIAPSHTVESAARYFNVSKTRIRQLVKAARMHGMEKPKFQKRTVRDNNVDLLLKISALEEAVTRLKTHKTENAASLR
jgi:hypothetical protein